MDIFNRPHSIAEDTLHYTLYPPSNLSDQTSATSFAACIADYVQSLCSDFVWHRDSFEVKVVSDPDNAKAWILEGRMRVGDCVDDEWFTVWLLKQISGKWDVAISVYDSDGEFLLIEAAEALPSWVKPTNSENRVWIYNSHLHLVPLSHTSPSSRKRRHRKLPGHADSDDEGGPSLGPGSSDDDDTFIAPPDAIALVRDPTVADTLAPPSVERLVWHRIAGYPDAKREHVHVTRAYVPQDVAKALSANPALVQRAVETFYTRDAIQLRAAHRMTRFPPHTAVLSSVKMTRTAYAQLVGQKFFPPKIFGTFKEPESSKEWKWRDVGMKIAVGFEMLYQESKSRTHGTARHSAAQESAAAEATQEALQRNPDYQKYITNLQNTEYFKGELKGSALWNDLENKAAAMFVEVRRTDDASRQSFATQADTAISKAGDIANFLTQDEDSDDWLNVDAQEFEEMLEATMKSAKSTAKTTHQSKGTKDPNAMDTDGGNGNSPEDRLAEEQAAQLKNLASKVEDFLEGEGDLEGATFEDEEEFSDEEFSDDESSDAAADSDGESDSDSESRSPESAEAKAARRQTAMANLVPALSEAEYGQMPASYHSNSQRVAPEKVDMESDADDSPMAQDADGSATASGPGGSAGAKASTNGAGASPKTNKTHAKPTMRPPIIPRDKYDGVDSDDETDDEGEMMDGEDDDESEEDRPQVVGDIEIDMDEEEEEFLEFSRQALGISDSQWAEIVKNRQDRGAFLPTSATKPSALKKPAPETQEEKPKPRTHTPRVPEPGPRPNVNPDLDSFETVMKALDEALQSKKNPKAKTSSAPPPSQPAKPSTAKNKGKGKAKEKISMPLVDEVDEDEAMADDDDFDIEAAMQAELREALEGFEEEGDEPMDYNMIKNFLESFKSQAGLSGPVSNLAGRLQPGFKLPRDDF